MKKISKTIFFFIGLYIILYNISYSLLPKKFGYNLLNYHHLNKQLDIIWLGPSTTRNTISPLYIWNKYHITSFNNAKIGQRLTSYFSIYDIKQYNPKLIFFDVTLLSQKQFTTFMHWENIYQWYLSTNYRYKFLNYTNGNIKNIFFIFLLNTYHTRWKELQEIDYIGNKISYYFMGSDRSPNNIRPQQQPILNKSKYSIEKENIKILEEIIQYTKRNNIDLILWFSPQANTELYNLSFQLNDIIKKFNINYVNFNELINNNEFQINYITDFADDRHSNNNIRKQINDYLVEYAIKNYNIKPHTNDPAYASWDEDYVKYARNINGLEIRSKQSFQEWQKQAYYDNYTMLISTNGDNVLNRIPQTMKDKFKTLGLKKFNTDKKNLKYAAIIDNNQVFFENVSDKKVEYKGRMKNIVNLLVSSENKKATINVSGKPRAKNKYGINFVIYDKVNREIVDSIWVDPSKPDVVRR